MTRAVLASVEADRRGRLTLEEILAFAMVLNVSPINLLVPADIHADAPVTPLVTQPAVWVRSWLAGKARLPWSEVDDPDESRRLDLEFLASGP